MCDCVRIYSGLAFSPSNSFHLNSLHKLSLFVKTEFLSPCMGEYLRFFLLMPKLTQRDNTYIYEKSFRCKRNQSISESI